MSELLEFASETGVLNLDWRNIVMLVAGVTFICVAVSKELEPYVLLPIGLGVIIAN